MSTKSSKPAKKSKIAALLASGTGKRPTRKGKPLKSSWLSRTHQRQTSKSDSPILCVQNSKSKTWKRDMISVAPAKAKQVTCGRCIRVRAGASAE